MAGRVLRDQELISKMLIFQFEKFLMLFDIEAKVEISKGRMLVKITEYADNLYLVQMDDDSIKRPVHKK